MAKTLSYDEFIEYSAKHYEKGGDVFVECWDEKTYKRFYPDGITKAEALELYASEYSHERDVAGYY